MRILFSCIRGQGHIRPLLPFAKEMKRRGHDVKIAAPDDMRLIAEKSGIHHVETDRLSDAELAGIWAGRQNLKGKEMLRLAVGEMFANRSARTSIPKLRLAIEDWKPDILVRDSVEFGAFVMGELFRLPHARVAVHNNFMEAGVIQQAGGPIDDLLADFDLPPQRGAGLWREPSFSALPAGFDGEAQHGPDNPPFRINPHLGSKPSETNWTPMTDRPLVYVTFGTVSGGEMFGFREVYDVALEAVSALDVEVLLTTGPNVDPEDFGPQPGHIQIRPFVPQDVVLQRASVVVHHGGSGTLTGAFAAGVPMVIVPLFADQPSNAEHAEAAGLGVCVAERSVEAISAATSLALSDASFRESARVVAEEMAEMPGVEAAVDRIEALAS